MIGLVGLIGILSITNNTFASDNLSGTYTSGNTITVTQAGRYYFKVAGDQGGDYLYGSSNYSGGKGGITGFEIELNV